MADQRVSASWSMNPKTGEITRREMFGAEVIKEEIVSRYDAEKQIVYFKSQALLMKFKIGVVTFLAADEKLIKSFQREDMKGDAPLTKNTPPRPKKDPMQGDKTPAVVEWYFRYRFNEFCARYGVFLNDKKQPIKYSGKVSYLRPVRRNRPVDDEPEYCGEERVDEVVTDVIVSTSKTHLTLLPIECVNWNEEEPDTYETDVGDETVGVRGSEKEGGE